MILNGRRDLGAIGSYRTHSEPMQIVSGVIGSSQVHFVAPPADRVPKEMELFLDWFQRTRSLTEEFPPLTRAGVAHIWFESIHPFEDGNGRIGRAISEKALSQTSSKPQFVYLAETMSRRRKEHYLKLQRASRTLDLTEWLLWFAEVVIEAQQRTITVVEFIIEKAKFFRKFATRLNPRQEKALLRMFREGPDGFKGGLSARKYIAITGATSPTTTRDLRDLVQKGALIRTGEKKSTKYWLTIPV